MNSPLSQSIAKLLTIVVASETSKKSSSLSLKNSHITSNNLINYTAQKQRRIDFKFCIGYNDDIAIAKEVIRKAVEACSYVLDDPKPVIAVGAHGDSSVVIDTLVWCKSENYWAAFYDMQERVKLDFDKAGINIPYNQLDVHITQN